MNPTLIKNFEADGAIAANRIVKFGTNDFEAAQAAAGTDAVFGVADSLGADDGARIDVVMAGIAEVELGGTVTRGALLTSDANGKAVATTTANDRVLGTAMVSGSAGDIAEVMIAISNV